MSLFSLILPSCIVVPKRKLVNKISSDYNFTNYNPMDPNVISKDVNMDILRRRSNFSSTYSSRELLIYSTASSVLYNDRME